MTIRVASWPHWYEPNPYVVLFHEALRHHGIEHVRHLPPDPALFGPTREADVFHVHWPEEWWTEGRRGLSPFLAVLRLHRFLRRLRRQRVPVVWTVHNVLPHENRPLTDGMGYRALHSLADLRIFHSEWARSLVMEIAPEGTGDTLVMPHGSPFGALPAPGEASDTRRSLGIPLERRLLLCFGQVREYKGFDVAVRAMDRLPHDRYHLVVAGRPVRGGERGVAAQAAQRSDVTLLLEEQSDRALADLLAAADAVLLPYRRVTSSGALLTALAERRGVVAADLPYFREVLAPEPQAVEWAVPGDRDSLADAVTRFFAPDAATRHEAALRLAGRYRWETVVEPVAHWLLDRCR